LLNGRSLFWVLADQGAGNNEARNCDDSCEGSSA
jgi:hypothetical protein